ncbi:MAG: T9SS type A sorting domain-containing protein [Bacteroidota bacterium]
MENIIYIDDLPSGVYVLSVRNDSGISHQRFIKK